MEILHNIGIFLLGGITVFWALARNYEFVKHPAEPSDDDSEPVEKEKEYDEVDEDFDNEESDDDHYYYVLLPDMEKPIQIAVEEKLALGHCVALLNNLYIVDQVIHRVNKHTVYALKFNKTTL